MTKHRVQADGTVRDSDNWQKGMTLSSYIKGLKRHVQHLWLRHRRWPVLDRKAGVDIKEDLCAIIFNGKGTCTSYSRPSWPAGRPTPTRWDNRDLAVTRQGARHPMKPMTPNATKIEVTEHILTCPVVLMAHDPDEGPTDIAARRPSVAHGGTWRP